MTRWGGLLALLLMVGIACAQAIDPLPFKDHAQEVRFQQLTQQLRCLVCQNESLADSNADLARDLRHQVFALMQQGRNDDEIKRYLVARYSTFVLYDPPLQRGTWLLWFGPLAILLLGLWVLARSLRRRRAAAVDGRLLDDPVNRPGDDW